MKKGSSGNRKRPPRQPQAPASRYPTRDNVYSLQQERQRRQQQEAQRQDSSSGISNMAARWKYSLRPKRKTEDGKTVI